MYIYKETTFNYFKENLIFLRNQWALTCGLPTLVFCKAQFYSSNILHTESRGGIGYHDIKYFIIDSAKDS